MEYEGKIRSPCILIPTTACMCISDSLKVNIQEKIYGRQGQILKIGKRSPPDQENQINRTRKMLENLKILLKKNETKPKTYESVPQIQSKLEQNPGLLKNCLVFFTYTRGGSGEGRIPKGKELSVTTRPLAAGRRHFSQASPPH